MVNGELIFDFYKLSWIYCFFFTVIIDLQFNKSGFPNFTAIIVLNHLYDISPRQKIADISLPVLGIGCAGFYDQSR